MKTKQPNKADAIASAVESGLVESLLRDYAPHVLASFPDERKPADPEATAPGIAGVATLPKGRASRF